jgi:hypothetical protein
MGFDLIARVAAKAAQDNLSPMIWRRRPSLLAGRLQGTATENAARLQAQIDALAADGGGTLQLVEDVIAIDRPLIVPAKVSVVGRGRNRCLIRNTRAPYNFHQSAAFLPGNFHPIATQAIYGNANAKVLNAVAKGDMAATLITAGDAAGYAVGDIVVFKSTSFYIDVNGYKIPAYMALRRVTKVSGAVLYVDEPFYDAFSGLAYNLRTGTLLGEPSVAGGTGLPLFAWTDGEIGGFSVETPGYWTCDTATYKAAFFDIEAKARALVYGNTFQHTRFSGVGGRFAMSAMETSLNSENVVVENMVASHDAAYAAELGVGYTVACTLQENNMAVTLRNSVIDVTGATSGAVIRMINCEDATVQDVTATHRGSGYTGEVVSIGDASPGAGRRVNRNASVRMNWSGGCGTYVTISGTTTAGASIDGNFRGAPSSVAVYLNGPTSRNSIARTAQFEQGRLRFTAGTVNQDVVGCYIGGGVDALYSADYSTLNGNNVREIRTANSATRRQATNAIAASYTVGTTEADVLSVSTGTGTLQRQDMIEFAARINLTGTAGTKTLNVKLINNTDTVTSTVVSYAIPATVTGIVEFSGRIHLTTPALIIPEATCSNTSVTVTRNAVTTDLSAKSVDVKVTAVRANAADTATIATTRLSLTNPVQV